MNQKLQAYVSAYVNCYDAQVNNVVVTEDEVKIYSNITPSVSSFDAIMLAEALQLTWMARYDRELNKTYFLIY